MCILAALAAISHVLDLQRPTLDVLLTVQPRTPLKKLSLGEWVIQHKCLTMPPCVHRVRDDRKDRVVSSDGREVMQFHWTLAQ